MARHGPGYGRICFAWEKLGLSKKLENPITEMQSGRRQRGVGTHLLGEGRWSCRRAERRPQVGLRSDLRMTVTETEMMGAYINKSTQDRL